MAATQPCTSLFPTLIESARDSPMSDHSSHLDSVSGTAIHLGRNSRASSAERGGGGHIQVVSLHQPVGKMSSLAKDAKECGPGLTRDSTLTRPAVPSSAAPSSTARKKCFNHYVQIRTSEIFGFINGTSKYRVAHGRGRQFVDFKTEVLSQYILDTLK